jgi:phosphate transport system substrate-binding protein
VGGKGNEGVAGLVKQTPNSIGYVELIYALQNQIPYGAVKNKAGNWLKASLESVTAAAAASAASMPGDFRVSITDAEAKDAYPIASYTWLLLYQNASDKDKARKMVDFVRWALTDGQAYTKDLGYAPLPASVVKLEQDALAGIQVH